jgi:GGDEF domain-containing protein
LFDDDVHVLSTDVFDYVFRNELKRAERSQNFVTLAVVQSRGEGHDSLKTLRAVAKMISSGIRETDLVGTTPNGQASIVLLDTDPGNAVRAIDRVVGRLKHYQFSPPVTFHVGVAWCPTHGCDVETLRAAAVSDLLSGRRSARDSDP